MLTVVPTIDVEGVHGTRPFEQLVLGEVGDTQTWGVYRMAEIFAKYGCSATFFVDVYEYTLWGEHALRDVCNRLIDMGQDVQLHTHPGWREDIRDPQWLRKLRRDHSYMGPDKDFMAKLSFTEQQHVIEHGMELLTRWTGRTPVAHRSGGYSINNDTVAALSSVGIPLDSSMNYSHEHSEVTWSRNAVVERNGVIELPVTVGCYTFSIPVGAARLAVSRRLKKTDLDLFEIADFRAYIDSAIENDVRLLNLFMHSYSLIDISANFTRIAPQPYDVYKLESLLRCALEMEQLQIMNCTEFAHAYELNASEFEGSDYVPEIPLGVGKIGYHLKQRGQRYWHQTSQYFNGRQY